MVIQKEYERIERNIYIYIILILNLRKNLAYKIVLMSISPGEIVLRCIRRWFGSEKTFEDTVRALLPSLFAEQLGRFGFPYWLLLVPGQIGPREDQGRKETRFFFACDTMFINVLCIYIYTHLYLIYKYYI